MDSESTLDIEQRHGIPQHNCFTLELLEHLGRTVTLSSDFDSGNLGSVVEEPNSTFRLRPCPDIQGVTGAKNWFYFKVKGFPAQYRARFVVEQMSCLYSFGRCQIGKKDQAYKPCRKVEGGEWEKFEDGVSVEKGEGDDTRLKFEHTFLKDDEEVAFAFTYPYEFHRYVAYVTRLEEKFAKEEELSFRKQLLSESVQMRPVYILTISSPEEKKVPSEKSKKPVVMITARVHPGEVPSSYTIQGVLDFLLSKRDLRAHILRKLFSFKIVPMLNPDGVYRGHYRMDSLGKNLNRYYSKDCSKEGQPSIFAVKNLIQTYSKEERLLFYIDLHGHAGRKGSFIYGNSLTDFVQHVEANVFCKLMAMNTTFFQSSHCNFSQKHMTHKDKYEELTKDNCGRVFAYKSSGMIHSFTLEIGYHFSNTTQVIQPSNTTFEVGKYSYIPSPKPQYKIFTPQAFIEVGEALLVSILDSVGFNPYSRVVSSQHQNVGLLRRATAFAIFQSDEKFRLFDMKTYTKVKNMNSAIHQHYYDKFDRIFKFHEIYKRLFQNPEWTNCVEKANSQARDPEVELLDANAIFKKEASQVDIKNKRRISTLSNNSSESSDLAVEIHQLPKKNLLKGEQAKRNCELKGLLEISQIKYGSATIVKNPLPSLQSRGVSPTFRNATADKQKKSKPFSLEIQSLKLKIKQEFAKEIKNQLIKEENSQPLFVSGQQSRKQHKSIHTRVSKDSTKHMSSLNGRDISPLNFRTLEPPRLSQVYLPFLSK